MISARSLRARLMVLILAPLAVIAIGLGYWRYTAALATAEELFDRSLLAATLAISRDVAISGGDALSPTTRDLMSEVAGGTIFYHVAGPDQAYVTGFAYPPVPPAGLSRTEPRPVYYESVHRSEPVRAIRMLEQTVAGPVSGSSTVTVWQRRTDRQAFAEAQSIQSAALISILVLSVAMVIWFSVNRGLRPLLDLEDAIDRRSSDDLSPIRRSVPREVTGVVSKLNQLFGQLRDAMHARDVFISNAAHQLRNPVAGMLALAEAAEAATTTDERDRRVAELKTSAERTARLTTQMLTLETLKGRSSGMQTEALDLSAVLTEVASRNAGLVLSAGIAFDFHGADERIALDGDRLMLEEAFENLIDNALRHGGPRMTQICVTVSATGQSAVVTVSDDGQGLSPEDAPTALERFGQVSPSEGSGLGLAIASEVAQMHKACLTVDGVDHGASISVHFDLSEPASRPEEQTRTATLR